MTALIRYCTRDGCSLPCMKNRNLCVEHQAARMKRQAASAEYNAAPKCVNCPNVRARKGSTYCDWCIDVIDRHNKEVAAKEQREAEIDEMLEWFRQEKANGRIR